jgi:hypothetical protein
MTGSSPCVQEEVGRGLSELAAKIKSDPTLTLPCKQGRGPNQGFPANM